MCLRTYASSADTDQPAHLRSLTSLRCPHEETFASLAIQSAHSEDSDQTTQMRMLTWIFAGAHVPRYVLSLCGSISLNWLYCCCHKLQNIVRTVSTEINTTGPPCEKVSSVICGQRSPRSACASTQSDLDLHRPQKE